MKNGDCMSDNKFMSFILCVFVSAILLPSFLPPQQYAVNETSTGRATHVPVEGYNTRYTVRPPIYINGDAGFTNASGVTWGSGTQADPYIIDGWEISTMADYGINIYGTTLCFEIRDCYLHGFNTTYSGIFLEGAGNGSVINTLVADSLNQGIRVSFSYNIRFENVTIQNTTNNGMYTEESGEIYLEGCHFSDTDQAGLHVNILTYGRVNDTVIDGCKQGIYTSTADYLAVENCTIQNTLEGDYMTGSENCSIKYCTISYPTPDVFEIYSPSGFLLEGNTFINSGPHLQGPLVNLQNVTLSANTAGGRTIHYVKDTPGAVVQNSNDPYILVNCPGAQVTGMGVSGAGCGLELAYCTGAELTESNFAGCGYGASFYYSPDSIVKNSTFEAGYIGVRLSDNNNVTIEYCDFRQNSDNGISVANLAGHNIYMNNFVDNIEGQMDSYDPNTMSKGGLGNFYSDYEIRYPSALNDGTVWDTWYWTNGMNNYDPYPLVHSVDIRPPVISHTPVTAWDEKTPLPISAVIEDKSGVSATLYYKNTSAGSYSSLALTHQGGGVYLATIPGDEVKLEGMSYYLRAVDLSVDTNQIYYGAGGETAVAPNAATDIDITISDIIPPTMTHTPVTSLVFGEDLTITLNATDINGINKTDAHFHQLSWAQNVTVNMTLQDGNYSATLPASQMALEPLYYYLEAVDNAPYRNTGYLGADGANYTPPALADMFAVDLLDQSPPSLVTYDAPASIEIDTPFEINVTFTDESVVSFSLLNYTDVSGVSASVDMAALGGGQYSCNVPAQPKIGNVSCFFLAEDDAGNSDVFPTFYVDIVDTVMPTITTPSYSLEVPVGGPAEIDFSVQDSGEIAAAGVLWNGTDGSPHNETATLTRETRNYTYTIPGQSLPGEMSFRLYASDTGGNWYFSDHYNVMVYTPDLQGPEIGLTYKSHITGNESLLVNATVADESGVSGVYVNYTDLSSDTHNETMVLVEGVYTYTIEPQHASGTLLFTVYAFDREGNWNSTPGSCDVTVDPRDTTPPHVVSSSPLEGGTVPVNGSVMIAFSEELSTTGDIGLTPLHDFEASIEGWDSVRIAFSAPLPYDTAYSLRMENVTDLAGNKMAGSFSLNFTTEESPVQTRLVYKNHTTVKSLGLVTGNGTITISDHSKGPVSSINENWFFVKTVQVLFNGTGELEWINITVSYNDEDIPPEVNEEDLKLYYWNESTSEWVMCERTGVDTTNNIVWGNVTHLTVFSAMGQADMPDVGAPGPDNSLFTVALVAGVVIIVVAVGMFFVVKRKGKKEPEPEPRSVGYVDCPMCGAPLEVPLAESAYPYSAVCESCGADENLSSVPDSVRERKEELAEPLPEPPTHGHMDCPKCEASIEVPFDESVYPCSVVCPECGAKGRLFVMPETVRQQLDELTLGDTVPELGEEEMAEPGDTMPELGEEEMAEPGEEELFEPDEELPDSQDEKSTPPTFPEGDEDDMDGLWDPED